MGEGGLKRMDDFGIFGGFQETNFWKNIGCLLPAPTFGLGGSRLCEKDTEISVKKRKRS